jgi:hypothetical protein
MRYISSEKVDTKNKESTIKKLFKEGETIPPMDLLQLPNLVLFRVSYPISAFTTGDKFAELYEIITYTNNFITLFNEERLIQHNIATLQKVIKKNKLQKMDAQSIKQGVKTNSEKVVSKEIIQSSMNEHKKQTIFTRASPPLMEKYTEGEEIEVKTLRVPISIREDTLLIPDSLLTIEPEPIKKERFPVWLIVLIVVIGILLLCFFFFRMRGSTKQNQDDNHHRKRTK